MPSREHAKLMAFFVLIQDCGAMHSPARRDFPSRVSTALSAFRNHAACSLFIPLKLCPPQIQHGRSKTLEHAAGMSMWTFPVPLHILHLGVFMFSILSNFREKVNRCTYRI